MDKFKTWYKDNEKKILPVIGAIALVAYFCAYSLNSHASSYNDLINWASDVFGISSGAFYGSATYDVSPIVNSLKTYEDSSSGSGTSSSPYVVSTNAVTTPRSIYNSNDNSVYNYATSNFETINNSYYYSNNYIYETDNYFLNYEYNYTYYTLSVAPISSPNDLVYYNIYYELPDGRSSLNLSADDIKGTVFCYDVVNYDCVATDDACLAIYHLDGSAVNEVNSQSTSTSYSYVSGRFGLGYAVYPSSSSSYSLRLYYNNGVNTSYTISFWFYAPVSSPTTVTYGSSYRNIIPVYGLWGEDAWHYCSYSTSDDYFLLDGSRYSKTSASSIFSALQSICSLDTTYSYIKCFGTIPSTQGSYTINSQTYGQTWYGYAIDEIYVSTDTGTYMPMRNEPYDLSFAYTVPSDIDYSYDSDLLTIYPYGEYTEVDFTPSVGTTYYICTNHASYATISDVKYVFIQTPAILETSGYVTNSFYVPISSLGVDPTSSIKPVFLVSATITSTYRFDYTIINLNNDMSTSGTNYYGCEVSDFKYAYPMYSWGFYSVSTTNPLVSSISYDSINPNTIAIQSPITLTSSQIGGVRPNFPSNGYCFIGLEGNIADTPIVWYNNQWNACEGAIFYGGKWCPLSEWDFSRQMLISYSDEESAKIIYNIDDSQTTYVTTNYYTVSGGDVTYNYNSNVTVSGNDIEVTVETSDDDGDNITDLLKWIPIFFGFMSTIVGLFLPIPAWLLGLIGTVLGVIVSLFIYCFVRRK